MSTAAPEIRSLAQEGSDALRRGDAARARDIFQRLTAALPNDTLSWLGLAFSYRALGDKDATNGALDRVLSIDRTNWRAFLLRADLFAEAGDARAASSFYTAALKFAPQHLPPELKAEFERARAMRERFEGEYEAYLKSTLGQKGLLAGSSRFEQSLDLLLGKKQLYMQQPRHYYFPELPQIQFYGRDQFPWLDALEAQTAEIRAELIEVLKDEGAFTPYIEPDPTRPHQDHHGMINNPNWTAFYLIKNGRLIEENARRCPKTLAAARMAPLADLKEDRSPSVMFSLLKPGARIPPHHGFVNVRAICHLGLIVPPNNVFRVGNEVRPWEEGKAWVFDDTIEHEAWNRSDQTRVILLFDVWKPELSDAERRMVRGMFHAIDAYGKQEEWNM